LEVGEPIVDYSQNGKPMFKVKSYQDVIQHQESERRAHSSGRSRIYLAAGVTDMRKGFEGLYGLVV
jgi:hypothetical protein